MEKEIEKIIEAHCSRGREGIGNGAEVRAVPMDLWGKAYIAVIDHRSIKEEYNEGVISLHEANSFGMSQAARSMEEFIFEKFGDI